MDKARPLGIYLVSIWTVVSALGVLLIGYILAYASIYPTYPTAAINKPWDIPWLITGLIFLGLGVLLLLDASLIFLAVKAGYFLSLAMWTLLFCAGVWWLAQSFFGATSMLTDPLFGYAASYTIVCSAYLLKKNVKTYFHK
jgi:hypothetical protein